MLTARALAALPSGTKLANPAHQTTLRVPPSVVPAAASVPWLQGSRVAFPHQRRRSEAVVPAARKAVVARSTPRRSVVSMAAGGGSLLALDFDGVLCDSCPESSLSAWKACLEYWPEEFKDAKDGELKDKIMQDMRLVRPVVETGYENMLLVRALYEKLKTPEELLEIWPQYHQELMTTWKLDRAEMVDVFGKTRDDWIEADLEGWLAPNEFYDGVVEATKSMMAVPDCETYIVTTKQARFTSMLMNNMAGIPFADDRIYSMTVSGKPKTEVLQMLAERHPGAALHFVEDKLSTLQKVVKMPEMDNWNLYFVDWGYNTVAERQWADEHPRIKLISMADYAKIVQ